MDIDRRCIALFTRKDEGAVTAVYYKTNRLLRHVAFSVLGDRDLAEDAMMDAYIKAMDPRLDFPNGQAFVSYLCKSTKNTALSMKAKLEKTVEIPDEEILPSEDAPIEQGVLSIMKRELSKEDYDIMILHVCQSYSFGEIGCYLELGSASSVRGRYFRAKTKVRDALTKEGIR